MRYEILPPGAWRRKFAWLPIRIENTMVWLELYERSTCDPRQLVRVIERPVDHGCPY